MAFSGPLFVFEGDILVRRGRFVGQWQRLGQQVPGLIPNTKSTPKNFHGISDLVDLFSSSRRELVFATNFTLDTNLEVKMAKDGFFCVYPGSQRPLKNSPLKLLMINPYKNNGLFPRTI